MVVNFHGDQIFVDFVRFLIHDKLWLGMLVPNDRINIKNGGQILHTTKHTLNMPYLRKADWMYTSNTINNIALL